MQEDTKKGSGGKDRGQAFAGGGMLPVCEINRALRSGKGEEKEKGEVRSHGEKSIYQTVFKKKFIVESSRHLCVSTGRSRLGEEITPPA